MKDQVSDMLSRAISIKLAQGPAFRFDGSREDVWERNVYFDDFIPVALEAFAGLYEQILVDHRELSADDIDMELLTLTRRQLRLP